MKDLPIGYRGKDLAQAIVAMRQEKNDTLTPLQLMKLVYFSHGWMLGKYGRPLVQDDFLAWEYGPVSVDLYNAMRKYKSSPVVLVEGAKPIELDAQAREVVDEVVSFYSKFDGIRLSALSHEVGAPWDITLRTEGPNAPISNDLIEHFYSQQLTSHHPHLDKAA